jgi:hypothetical protein
MVHGIERRDIFLDVAALARDRSSGHGVIPGACPRIGIVARKWGSEAKLA